MGALGNGDFRFWLRFSSNSNRYRHFRKAKSSSSSSSKSINSNQGSNWGLSKFPLKQSLIASGLSLTGDTIAQLRDRYLKRQGIESESKDNTPVPWSDHDWLRSLRMASYGFLFYGPGSYAWYKLLDNYMPNPTVVNLSTKVLLNQIILGPCVIAVIFAWNNLWLGKLPDLPSKYQKDAIPTLLYGFRFWIPVSILNFGVVPLSSRVAFMSVASIFWNFYLSTTMSK